MRKLRKMTVEQVSKIKELSTQGMSPYKIAREMRIPPGVAKYHIDREKKGIIDPFASKSVTKRHFGVETINMLKKEIEKLKQKNEIYLELLSTHLIG